MLRTLHIENYALITLADIDFDGGFVAITGETGAGKSILLGALSLLLGQRADTKVLSDRTRKCIVEAHFLFDNPKIKAILSEGDVDYADDGIVIIRREILPSGKSRAFVNDTPVPLPLLRQLGSSLVDIHSQHATLLLAESDFQTSLLDSIGNAAKPLDEYRQAYDNYTKLKQQLEQLTADDAQSRKDYDYNKFLFDELEKADLNETEQDELEQEASLLANAEDIKQSLSQVAELCDGEEDSALSRLNVSKSLVSKIASLNTQISSVNDRLESTIIELRDIISTIESLNDDISYSPERQQQVDERLDLIYRLQKKHGVNTIAELLQIKDSLEERLSSVDLNDQRIHQIMEEVDKAFKVVQQKADILTACRQKAATTLCDEVQPILSELGMPNATIVARVDVSAHYTSNGNNNIQLLFNANKGGEPRELSKVASGGEMSRLMLAIKALTARSTLLPTVIFDEIDTGISGDISVKVGRIMQRMSQGMQVVAITHLPQIAARANQHYKVYKNDDSGRTTSNIRQLGDDERRYEIAVMLSSEPPSDAALQTAAELMEDR